MFQHSLRDMIGGIRAHAEAEAAYVQNAVVPAVRKEAKAPDPRMKVRLSRRGRGAGTGVSGAGGAEGTASGVPREAFGPWDLALPQISAPLNNTSSRAQLPAAGDELGLPAPSVDGHRSARCGRFEED